MKASEHMCNGRLEPLCTLYDPSVYWRVGSSRTNGHLLFGFICVPWAMIEYIGRTVTEVTGRLYASHLFFALSQMIVKRLPSC